MKLKLILLIFCLFSAPLYAQWNKVSSQTFTLPAPPQKGSIAYEQDFAQLFEYQEKRSEHECELARSQPHPDFDDMFHASGLLSQSELELARPLVSEAMKLAERIARYHKNKFKRPRPFTANKNIRPCTWKPSGNTSYPSSHAASASMGACVLALYFPARASELIQYGNYLGELRVISGVHHPSDVKAGQSLGQEICLYLQEQADFMAELNPPI